MFFTKKFYSKKRKISPQGFPISKRIYCIDDSYGTLLLPSNSVSIHQRHLQFLMQRYLKAYPRIYIIPKFMWSCFKEKKLFRELGKGPYYDTHYGTIAVHIRGSLVWNNLPANIKSNNSVSEFKAKIKNLGNIDFDYLICR